MATTKTRQKRISRSITIVQHHLLASTADLQPRCPTTASHQRLHLHLREPVPSPPVTIALHPYTSAHQIGKEDTPHLQSPSSRCQQYLPHFHNHHRNHLLPHAAAMAAPVPSPSTAQQPSRRSSATSRLHRLHSHRCSNEHHHAGEEAGAAAPSAVIAISISIASAETLILERESALSRVSI